MSVESILKEAEQKLAGVVHTVAADVKLVPTEIDKAVASVVADAKPFAEHAAIAALQDAAKLRIAALDEMTKAKTELLALLESEKARTVADAATLKSKVEALLASLASEAATVATQAVAAAVTKAA